VLRGGRKIKNHEHTATGARGALHCPQLERSVGFIQATRPS